MVIDKTKLANLFNLYYVNIVENTSGVPPVIQGNPNNPYEDNITVKISLNKMKITVVL